ncbi:MAG: c-type cytochrome [Planctomycetia bacterium]|nr:c-type cytochrome [Planctomycetia bacterium]
MQIRFQPGRTWRNLALVLSWALALSGGNAARGETPHWMIGTDQDGKARPVSKSFSIDEPVQTAELKLAADFCTATVTLNGQPVIAVEPYCPLQVVDVTRHLRRGKNELAVATTPVAGPSAVAVSLALMKKDGAATTIVSDESWQGAESRGLVPPEQWGLERRSAEISPFDNYEQWQQDKGNGVDKGPKFWLAPGFEVTRVRQAAADEGSWIALAFDRQGRATISREDTGLLRMTLAADRGAVTRVEPINVDLPECRGLLYIDGQLYANANNARSMYRLRIDEAGAVHDLQRLREFPGGVGHGRNDLALGPDGLVYSIHGDSVQAPGQPIVDRTSPLRESRRGPARHEAYVVRGDRDGKRWELLCTGLRNPYGIAFNKTGDLFTYDADNEYDMGTPWYRPTRIVQLVSGADYGYREAGGRWPPEFPDHPDNGLPTIDVGRGSPTAVMFGTHLDFPSPYREALFALDWSYGRVLAVHLAPRGAGYRAALELFMQGKPLNVTDLAAGPDGAMWLITGGRKTRSALYRVARTGTTEPAPAPGRHEKEAAEFAARQREQRLKLEALHVSPGEADAHTAWRELGNADPLIRHAARIALEQRSQKELFARHDALRATGAIGDTALPIRARRLEFLQSVARLGDPARAASVVDELLELPSAGLDLSAQFVIAFLYAECLARAPQGVAGRSERVARQLAGFWPDPASDGLRVSPFGTSLELRRRLARLLSALGDPSLVDRVAKTLLPGPAQEDRLLGLLALRNTRHGWTGSTRREYFTALRDARKFVGGEGLPAFLDRLRTDSLATLGEGERSALEDLLAPGAADDEPLPPQRRKVALWTLDDLKPLAEKDALPGDAKRGAAIFREALCSRCHRAGATGPAVGPDLTFVARRFGRGDMLEAIVEPSRSVAENYRNVNIVTESGQVLVGRLASTGDFRAEKLRLNIDPLRPGEVVVIDKKEVAEQRLADTSPMPQGLLDGFTREEIADLLAFLEDGS